MQNLGDKESDIISEEKLFTNFIVISFFISVLSFGLTYSGIIRSIYQLGPILIGIFIIRIIYLILICSSSQIEWQEKSKFMNYLGKIIILDIIANVFVVIKFPFIQFLYPILILVLFLKLGLIYELQPLFYLILITDIPACSTCPYSADSYFAAFLVSFPFAGGFVLIILGIIIYLGKILSAKDSKTIFIKFKPILLFGISVIITIWIYGTAMLLIFVYKNFKLVLT